MNFEPEKTTADGESTDGDGAEQGGGDAGVSESPDGGRVIPNRNSSVSVNRGESLSHLSADNRAFLEDGFADPVDGLDSVVTMRRVRERNPWKHAQILKYATKGSRNRVRLIRLLVERPTGTTLQAIDSRLDVSKQRRREYVAELRDAGIVEQNGKPAVVQFTTDVVRLLAQDVAATYL